MSDFVNTVDIVDDDVLMDGLIDKSISGSFNDDKITAIKPYAFYGCTNLESVCFPNATSIGAGVFSGTGLKAITAETFPFVTSIGGSNAGNFFSNSQLSSVYWPGLVGLYGGNLFANCKSLKSANLPNLSTMGTYGMSMFNECTALKEVNLPLVSSVEDSTFRSCTSLETITLPSVTRVGGNAFNGCSSLRTVDLPVCTELGYSYEYNIFGNCSQLEAIILRSTTMCTLSNNTHFKNSSIINGEGYIYVPKALMDSYKAAANWSNYAAQFRALEDYTVDGTTTGELREKTESLSLNVTELTFSDVNTQTLTATGVFGIYDAITWTTSDKTIARVKNGIVTPVKDGTATITVTCGDYSATCAVTVNAGLEVSANILDNIDWNAGYIDNNGSITAGGTADTYTTKFDISEYSDASIIVTLLDVTSNPTYSRICYYNESESIIGATQGAAGSGYVTITSTVPNNAVYAAISINKSGGLSGIEITCDNVLIGYVEYTS